MHECLRYCRLWLRDATNGMPSSSVLRDLSEVELSWARMSVSAFDIDGCANEGTCCLMALHGNLSTQTLEVAWSYRHLGEIGAD